MRKLKTITSYTGHARFLAACANEGEPIAWLARLQVPVPEPYRYSPVVSVVRWNGKEVILRETAHRRFEVFEVPAEMRRFTTAQAAEVYNITLAR